jgi:hypothetical protein
MDFVSLLAWTGAGWAVVFGLSVTTALIHEAGHALAWSLIGARIVEVGYANPGGRALRFKVGRLTFAFNPFTVFAYTLIESPGEQLHKMTTAQRMFVHGAGIMANLLAAGACLAIDSPYLHLFAAFSAVLAFQNVFFKDGSRIMSALSKSQMVRSIAQL